MMRPFHRPFAFALGRALALSVVAALTACSSHETPQSDQEKAAAPAEPRTAAVESTAQGTGATTGDYTIESPATYSGDLPCATCPRRTMTVTLFPDGTFRLRFVYVGVAAGEDDVTYDLGRWERLAPGDRLTLYGGEWAQRLHGFRSGDRVNMWLFGFRDDDRAIHMFDLERYERSGVYFDDIPEGENFLSAFGWDLERQDAVDRIEGPMVLRGMYTYMADAAALTECLTGKRFPVLIEGDHIALERAYLDPPHEPGAPVCVGILGRFVERAPEPGMPPREHVRVERFLSKWSDETCPPPDAPNASLVNTYWKAVLILGKEVALEEGQREPQVILAPHGGEARGFAGCNRFTGRYEVDEKGLRISRLATTRMACSPEAMEMETAFLAAIGRVSTYLIIADELELYDSQGEALMRLEAVYLE